MGCSSRQTRAERKRPGHNRREIFEETGIAATQIERLGAHEIQMPHGAVVMNTFKVVVPDGTQIVVNPEEHEAYRWFELPELLAAPDIIWALPTTLRDFGFIAELGHDHTLLDGSSCTLLKP